MRERATEREKEGGRERLLARLHGYVCEGVIKVAPVDHLLVIVQDICQIADTSTHIHIRKKDRHFFRLGKA